MGCAGSKRAAALDHTEIDVTAPADAPAAAVVTKEVGLRAVPTGESSSGAAEPEGGAACEACQEEVVSR